MRIAIALTCVLLLGSASAAAAQTQYYFTQNGSIFYAGNADANAARARAATPDVVEHVFFTPVSGYQRSGYQCVPLVEIATVNGRRIRRPGTVCRDGI